MGTKVKIQFNPIQKIIVSRGLNRNGKVQLLLANEVAKHSDPYVPFRSGALRKTKVIASDGTYVQYITPYARYHWYGKLMVGTAPKTVTDTDMTYQGAPMRGPKWAMRMWKDRGKQIVKKLQREVNS